MAITQTPSQGAPLFNELVDMVIDHLHDDKHSLKACSLVSQTFKNSSQYHLLENLSLSGVYELEKFMALVKESPRFGHYVRTLRVFGEGSWFGKHDDAEMRLLSLGPSHLHFLSQLPALHRLLLAELLWDAERDGPAGLAMLTQAPRAVALEKLVLHHVTSRRFQQPGAIHHGIDAQDVLDVLSPFAAIRTLSFATPRLELDAPPHDPAMPLEERFHRLRVPQRLSVQKLVADPDALDSARTAVAYAMLDRVCDAKSLRSFRTKVKPGDLDAISHFIAVRGPYLSHYYLDMAAYFTLSKLGPNETFSLLGLSSCTSLETFELRTPCYPPERLWYYILTALSQLPPTIRHIKICVYLTSTLPNSLEDACQGAINSRLDHLATLPHLESLEFTLRHPYGSDAVYPYRFQKCKRMLMGAMEEPLRERVLSVKSCECFIDPTPEPLCMSVLMQSPALM